MLSVAVVIPVLNEERSIGECVAACLQQTLSGQEVVVVDNGSADHTAAVASSAGAKVLHEPKPGAPAALNRGWLSLNADIVAFTDGDVIPSERWLEELTKPFADPEVAGAGGPIVIKDCTSAPQRQIDRLFGQFEFGRLPGWIPAFIPTANVAYRRSVLHKVGGFDDQLKTGYDADLSWRVQLAGGRLAHQPEAVVYHQIEDRLSEVYERYYHYAGGQALLAQRWGSVFRDRIRASRKNADSSAVDPPWGQVRPAPDHRSQAKPPPPATRLVALASYAGGLGRGAVRARRVKLRTLLPDGTLSPPVIPDISAPPPSG